MRALTLLGAAAVALASATGAARAETKIDFVLNWVVGGDHAPYFFAKKQGWYKEAGIDAGFEPGRGSTAAVQKVGVGQSQMGLADLGTVLVGIGKGADVVAVMNVYANSPYGMYWKKSSGITGVKDFPGKKIGNPPADAARQMWPALAKAVGIDPDSVTWVNVQANAKLAALKAGSIDVTTSFYNIHHIFQRELGDDMGYVAWKEHDINPYGNSIIANRDFLEKNREAVGKFTAVTQKAFHACANEPEPCVRALVEANTGLIFENEMENWRLVAELMSDETSRTVALGWFDPERVKRDYELVETYFTLDKPFDVTQHVTNEFLSKDLKMPGS